MASQMYDHFGDVAHLAVVLADREARALGHPLVDTEHLLLGVLEADADLARAVAPAGMAPDVVRAQVVALLGADTPLGRGETVFTAGLNRTLQGAALFARRKEREVTCSDLLVELLDADQGAAGQVVARLGIDPSMIRRLVGPAKSGDDDRPRVPARSLERVRRFVAPRS